MSDAGMVTAPATFAQKALRIFSTLVIFAVFGPLIGGIVTIVGIGLFGIGGPDAGAAGAVIAVMILYGLWVAYPLGVLPALGVGLVIAILDIRGGTRFPVAAAIGLFAGIGWGFSLWGQPTENGFLMWVVTAGALAATLSCWALTRPGVLFFRRPITS